MERSSVWLLAAGLAVHALAGAPAWAQDEPVNILESTNWSACVEQASGGRKLVVSGSVTLPNGGYEVQLREAAQGSNDNQLAYNLRIRVLPGDWLQEAKTKTPRAEKTPYEGKQKSVGITQPDGSVKTAEIKPSC